MAAGGDAESGPVHVVGEWGPACILEVQPPLLMQCFWQRQHQQSGMMHVWLHPCVGHCGVTGGAVVVNTLPPIVGRDPAGSNACGAAGITGGSEFSTVIQDWKVMPRGHSQTVVDLDILHNRLIFCLELPSYQQYCFPLALHVVLCISVLPTVCIIMLGQLSIL